MRETIERASILRDRPVTVSIGYAVATPDDPQPLIADGLWRGEFIDTPRGEGGFGYDPHFWLPALGCTVAQLAPERKNALGHRGQAMRALLEKLRAVTAP